MAADLYFRYFQTGLRLLRAATIGSAHRCLRIRRKTRSHFNDSFLAVGVRSSLPFACFWLAGLHGSIGFAVETSG